MCGMAGPSKNVMMSVEERKVQTIDVASTQSLMSSSQDGEKNNERNLGQSALWMATHVDL